MVHTPDKKIKQKQYDNFKDPQSPQLSNSSRNSDSEASGLCVHGLFGGVFPAAMLEQGFRPASCASRPLRAPQPGRRQLSSPRQQISALCHR